MKPEALQKLLEARAAKLARADAEEAGAGPGTTLLLFTLGVLRFGVDLREVREVVPIEETVAVPLAPPILGGLVNLHGAVTPAMDLGILLGLGSQLFDRRAGLVVEDPPGRLVILVGKIEDLQTRPREAFGDVPAGLPPQARSLIREATDDGVAVLDVARLLQDPRLNLEPVGGWGS